MKRAAKKDIVTVGPPSMQLALDTFAYHAASIMTDCPRDRKATHYIARFGMGGYAPGCPLVIVEIAIVPNLDHFHDNAWGDWAQTTVNGKHTGNRCGARMEYARLCAPVLQWLAEHHAAEAAKKTA